MNTLAEPVLWLNLYRSWFGTNFSSEQAISTRPNIIIPQAYTPGIYAEGYIVFVFPFVGLYVRSFVCSFVLPSVAWNLRQSFASKFPKWCISQQLLIRKHSYLDHSYPGGLAFTACPRTPGSMPRGGARGQNLGHL